MMHPYIYAGIDKVKDINSLIKAICKEYFITFEELSGKSREEPLPDARKLFGLIATNCLPEKISYNNIGNMLNRDHSTVSYWVKRGKQLLEIDKDFLNKYNKLKALR